MQLGSWFYMAPEQQAAPHEAEAASDLYALAVSWIQMVTGSLPSPQAVGAREYEMPLGKKKIVDIINRMLSYKPQDRPCVDEVIAALVV